MDEYDDWDGYGYDDPAAYIPIDYPSDVAGDDPIMLDPFGVESTPIHDDPIGDPFSDLDFGDPFLWDWQADYDPFYDTGMVAVDPRLNDGQVYDPGTHQPAAAQSDASKALAALGNMLKSLLGKVSAGASGGGSISGGSSSGAQQPATQKRAIGTQRLPDGRVATFWSDGSITYSMPSVLASAGGGLDTNTALLAGVGLVGLALALR